MIGFKRSTDNMPSSKLTFWLISLILITAFVVNATFTIQQNNNLYQAKMESIKKQVQNSFQQSVDNLDNQFKILIDHYSSMQSITKSIALADQQTLYSLVRDDYRKLKDHDPYLIGMHFIDPNNVTILRMHKADSHGDDLTGIRPIIEQVNRTQQQASGFEPGKNGITYRVTTPIFDKENTHLGVLEFGIKPEYFIDTLSQRFEIKSQVLVKTDTLKHLTYNPGFEKVDDCSIIFKDSIFNGLDIDLKQEHQFVQKADKTYLVISDIFLTNYRGQESVRFQVLKDVTEFHDKYNYQMSLYIVVNIGFTLFFLGLLVFVFSRFTQQISDAFNRLKVSQNRERAIQHKSRRDELTNAYNRRHFNVLMNDLLNDKALLEEHEYSVIFFDIDFFKKVNDEHGHLVGDEVLKTLSRLVISLSRVNDLLFRWGGEEFCLLMLDTSKDKAVEKAENMRQQVELHRWPRGINLTISLGVTQIRSNDDLQSLQLRVDELLYQAKEQGRNRTVSD